MTTENIIQLTGCARIMETTPYAYRLIKGLDGVTRLQGAYRWEEGASRGIEWSTIQTVEEPETTTEWIELKTCKEVFDRQAEGWKIETDLGINDWTPWIGVNWSNDQQYRGRPAQPKTCGAWAGDGPCVLPVGHNMGHADIPENHSSGKRTVTSECWRDSTNGSLFWCKANSGLKSPWRRFPCGDRTGEVEE